MYAVGDDRLLMVASDRVSAFDVVMDEPIPGKGAVLTALSAFWFRKTADLVPQSSDLRSVEDLPAEVTTTREADRMADGCWCAAPSGSTSSASCAATSRVAAGRSTGAWAPSPANRCRPAWSSRSGWREPIFTPAIKAESGHDENISRARLAATGRRGARAAAGAAEPRAVRGRRRARAEPRADPGRHQVRVRRARRRDAS